MKIVIAAVIFAAVLLGGQRIAAEIECHGALDQFKPLYDKLQTPPAAIDWAVHACVMQKAWI